MDMRLLAAWLSRHAPTEKQLKELRGYRVVQVNPEGRNTNAWDAWWTSATSVNGKPDAIFTAMNGNALRNLVKYAYGQTDGMCEVVRPIYNNVFRDRWEGKWERAIWKPDTDEIVMVRWYPRPVVVLPQDIEDMSHEQFSQAPINKLRSR